MKYLKIFTIVLFFCSNIIIFAQTFEKDTIQARIYLEKAKDFSEIKNLDSSFYYIEKVDNICVKYNFINSNLYAECLYIKATNLIHNFDLNFAKKILLKSLEINKKNNNFFGINDNYIRLGNCFYYQDKFDSCLYYYNIAQSHILKKQNLNTEKIYNAIAIVYFSKATLFGNLKIIDSSLFYYNLSNLYLSKVTKNNVYLKYLIYNGIANCYDNVGLFDKAIDIYYKNIFFLNTIYNYETFYNAMIYENIATSLYKIGKIEQSKLFSLKALSIFENNDDKYYLMELYANISIILSDESFYESKKYIDKSIKLNKKLYNNTINSFLANSYSNLAYIFFQNQNFDSSLFYYKKTSYIYKQIYGDASSYYSEALKNIASCFVSKQLFDSAEFYFQKSLNLFKNLYGDKNYNTADLYNDMGNLEMERNNNLIALKYFQKSICSYFNYNDTVNYTNPNVLLYNSTNKYIEVFLNKAQCLKKLSEQNADKLKYLILANDCYQKCDTIIHNFQVHFSDYSDLREVAKLSDMTYKNGYINCLNIISNLKNEKLKYDFENTLFYFLQKTKYSVLVKGKKIYENMSSETKDSIEMLNAEINYYKNLTITEYDDSIKSIYNSMIFEKITKVQQIEKGYKIIEQNKNKKTSDIQQIITNNQIIVEFVIIDSVLYTFIITKDYYKYFDKKLSYDFYDMLSNYNSELRNYTFKKNELPSFTKNSIFLYNELINNIEKYIKNKTEIIIIPDIKLSSLPFETLIYKQPKKNKNGEYQYNYLIEKFTISYKLSSNFIQEKQEKKFDKYWIGFAPVFNSEFFIDTLDYTNPNVIEQNLLRSNFDSLPYSKIEIEEIFKFVEKKEADKIIGFEANELKFKELKQNEYRIVHLATHSFFNNKSQNGIVFYEKNNEDGILYLNEVSSLKAKPELLVLSSCSSGIGNIVNGEGNNSLNAAFFYNGIQHIIVSLWNVNDEGTSVLFINFYKKLLKETEYSNSLQKAKIKMINSDKFYQPYYWAGFVKY